MLSNKIFVSCNLSRTDNALSLAPVQPLLQVPEPCQVYQKIFSLSTGNNVKEKKVPLQTNEATPLKFQMSMSYRQPVTENL